jgi:ATP-dependent DNA helicase RecG
LHRALSRLRALAATCYFSLMRPHVLTPLFAAASTLPGVGPKIAKLLDRLTGRAGGARVFDLLSHLPYATIDRRRRPRIAEAPLGEIVLFRAVVSDLRPPASRNSKTPYRVLVEDETGDATLVFFHYNPDWLARSLPLGETRWISGKLELWDGFRQISHPEVYDSAAVEKLAPVEPIYGLTEGLYPRVLAKAMSAALDRVPDLPEWCDTAFLAKRGLPSFKAALATLHRPETPEAIGAETPARVRLAYDELLANQLALALVRAKMRETAGRASSGRGELEKRILAALPFSPTRAQTQALAEIIADLAAPKRMLRLLQGDVGSGKTLVALIAMSHVVEAGRQAALMAPTENLARQHYESISRMAAPASLRVALLTGRDKASERARARAALAAGEIDIAIGTHALFQESVAFRDLGLAVVDEQHRFGVHQRLALGDKGTAADVLVMTATPIPRTLVLTCFGDMDVSALREKPAGRQPIDTRAMPLERLDEVVAGVGRAIRAGARVYWVCPLVEESEALDVAAAQERYETLRMNFGAAVGLVHGKMKGADKDAAMAAFQRGETQILVATTVIEVGVDVPEASVIVIEHAERFGLAQLHQLRGRVGRGAAKSSCLLLYKGPLGETAQARIAIMRETEDGFRIAEEDLRLRGEGEVLGTRQSGTPGFRFADLSAHAGLLPVARDDARLILTRDADLKSARGEALRALLYLFERDEAVRLLRAG